MEIHMCLFRSFIMRLLSTALGLSFVLSASFLAPATAGHHKSGEGESSHASRGGERFSDVDSDGSGTISEAEFVAQAAKRFAEMDADSDGVLSKTEMKRRARKH
jgi:hypothetical protein